jgi:ABC-type transport system involved in cytochrome c biogenesis permease subunit
VDYPQFFYGFLSVAFAWQLAFLVIGRDPVRFRPLMLAGIVEKLGYVLILIVLHGLARISTADAMAAVPDLLLGILFIAAFVKTRAAG